jgi:hypothetical protein
MVWQQSVTLEFTFINKHNYIIYFLNLRQFIKDTTDNMINMVTQRKKEKSNSLKCQIHLQYLHLGKKIIFIDNSSLKKIIFETKNGKVKHVEIPSLKISSTKKYS